MGKKAKSAEIRNQNLKMPFIPDGRLEDYYTEAIQRPFYLLEADYNILKSDKSALSSIAMNVAASAFIFFITLIIKFSYEAFIKSPSSVGIIDCVTILVLVVSVIILLIINCLYPGKRGEIIRRIDKHFSLHTANFEIRQSHGPIAKQSS